MTAMTAMAQNAREINVKFKNAQQPAVIADFMADDDFVEDALKEKLATEGFGKKSSESGFQSYKAVQWGRVSSEKLDVYIKVDGKKGKSTVTILAAKGYDNFISSAKDASATGKIQEFLNSFSTYVNTRKSIATQESMVKKMEDENAKLVKSKEEFEKKLVDMNSAISQKQAQINTEKLKIEELKKSLN